MNQKTKKLYRSKEDKIIAGVAGGLGEYFNVDPLFVRLIFVFLALVHGLGILFYIIFIFIIPKKGEKQIDVAETEEKIKELGKEVSQGAKAATEKIEKHSKGLFRDRKRLIGFVILLVGALALLNDVLPLNWFQWDIFWKAALIVVGIYLLLKTNKNDK